MVTKNDVLIIIVLLFLTVFIFPERNPDLEIKNISYIEPTINITSPQNQSFEQQILFDLREDKVQKSMNTFLSLGNTIYPENSIIGWAILGIIGFFSVIILMRLWEKIENLLSGFGFRSEER